MDIKELLEKDLSNKEIAEILNKSIRTVSRYREMYGVKSIRLSEFDISNHKNEVLEYLKNGKTDAEISRILNCNTETIRQFRLKNNILPNFTYESFRIHNYKLIKEMIIEGFKDREISKILNIPEISIYNIRIKNKIERDSYNISKPIKPNDFQKSVLIGTIFGDTHISLPEGSLNCMGKMEHCLAQRDYIHYKYDILNNLCSPYFYCYTRKNPFHGKDNRNHVEYVDSVIVRLKSNPELNWYRNIFYKPKKTITKELLQHYDYISLAFHIMDDGYYNKKAIILCNDYFSKEENLLFINHLQQNLKITCTLQNNNKRVYIRRENYEFILEKCKQYFCESMLYKLGL